MIIQPINLQLAAQDLRFPEVRAREEERIRAAQAQPASSNSPQLVRRLLAALHRELRRNKPQAAPQVAVQLKPSAR